MKKLISILVCLLLVGLCVVAQAGDKASFPDSYIRDWLTLWDFYHDCADPQYSAEVRFEYEYKDYGDMHLVWQVEVITETCSNCGYSSETKGSESQPFFENHSVSDGVCVLCGHVAFENDQPIDHGEGESDNSSNNCLHESTTKKFFAEPNWIEYKEIDKGMHNVWANYGYEVICDQCNTVLSRGEEPIIIRSEEHQYDENGKCFYCQYVQDSGTPEPDPDDSNKQECSHPSYIQRNKTEHTYEPEGSLGHYHKELTTVSTFCSICGKYIGQNQENKKQPNIEPHEYRNHRCIFCGYYDGEIDNDEQNYYNRLILAIQNKQNPLEDNGIEEIIHQRIKDSGLGVEKKINQLIDTLKKEPPTYIGNGPVTYRDLFLLAFFNYDMELEGDNGCRYNSGDNVMYIDKEEHAGGFFATFFHENGHAVDRNICETIKETDGQGVEKTRINEIEDQRFGENYKAIREALIKDVQNKIKDILLERYPGATKEEIEMIQAAFINSDEERKGGFYNQGVLSHESLTGNSRLQNMYFDVMEEYRKQIKAVSYSNASMVSDMNAAVTCCKIANDGCHPYDYWLVKDENNNITYDENGKAIFSDKKMLGEAWAEFFSAMIQGDAYNIKMNCEFYPEATKALDDYAKSLYDYYYEYYTKYFIAETI